MPIIKMPSAPIRNDRKNEPNIEPVLPNGFAMKLLNAKKIGMKDKRKRRNPTIRNAIPSCRSRGPDSPKSVAPPGIAAPGPPTILAPAFDGQPKMKLCEENLMEVSGRGFEPRTSGCPRSAAVRLRQNPMSPRSEEHTSELQSRLHLVCRLLLEKKKKTKFHCITIAASPPTFNCCTRTSH